MKDTSASQGSRRMANELDRMKDVEPAPLVRITNMYVRQASRAAQMQQILMSWGVDRTDCPTAQLNAWAKANPGITSIVELARAWKDQVLTRS